MQILYSVPDDFHIWIHRRQSFVVYFFCWFFFLVIIFDVKLNTTLSEEILWDLFKHDFLSRGLAFPSARILSGLPTWDHSGWGFQLEVPPDIPTLWILTTHSVWIKVCGSGEVFFLILFYRKYCNSKKRGFNIAYYGDIFSTLWPELSEQEKEQ